MTRQPSLIPTDRTWIDRLSRRLASPSPSHLSRRGLARLMIGAAGSVLLGASGCSRAAARQATGVRQALDDIVTAEALLVTYLGVARSLEAELRMDDDLVRLVRAVQCEEDAHHNVLTAAGGIPATPSFTVVSLIDGSGDKTAYPGPRERYCRGVVGLVPETTDDQPAEDAASDDAAADPADATPVARSNLTRPSGGSR